MKIKFLKMNVYGNDFIIIDNRDKIINSNSYQNLAKILCQRKTSIGADGIIFIEESDFGDAKMCYYNSDGSRAEMCGNGVRCMAYYVCSLNGRREINVETDAGVVNCWVNNGYVKMKSVKPKNVEVGIKIDVDGKTFEVSFVDVGVPHVVIFSDDVEDLDVSGIGRKIRFHNKFQPSGTNVNFVKVLGESELLVRTYERGVEDETYSCGTGMISSAFIAKLIKGFFSPIRLKTLNNGEFIIYFEGNDICLESKVNFCFSGEIVIDEELVSCKG